MSAPNGCSFTFIGNATTLLRFGPLTVLTDPNFLHRGQFAYLGKGVFSRRLKDPAMGVSELPALDGIVLSHMHGDHWDRVARNGLDRSTPVLTTPEAARALYRQHFTSSEGLTGDTLFVDDLREIPSRYSAIDVALVHLGGTTLPGGFVVTMDGREGTDLVELVSPERAIPIHFDDYGRFKSPLSDFEEEIGKRGLADRMRVVPRGQSIGLPPP